MKRAPAGHRARAWKRARRRTPSAGVARSGRNSAPWFLKGWGSRPAHKLTPASLAHVA